MVIASENLGAGYSRRSACICKLSEFHYCQRPGRRRGAAAMTGETLGTADIDSEFPLRIPAAFAGEEHFIWQTHQTRDRLLRTSRYLTIALCEEGAGMGAFYTETACEEFHDSALCLIPPHCFYHIERGGGDWRFLYVDAESVALRMHQGGKDAQRALLQKLRPQVYPISHIHCRNIYTLVKLIGAELDQKKDMYRESVSGMCGMLLVSIARRSQGESAIDLGRDRQGALSEHIRPALQYIEEHYTQPLKVSEMAAASHLSESHFRRVFEQCMKRTPGDYLNFVRIRNACDYLLQDHYTVEEIAARVGYGNISTFYRNFNRFIGKSPFQWRKEKKIL